ncbi:hypothetical protein [Arthrobacter celericrescens]|uniref:hypothetical protein n=1 Tax=Arthrobacter celericrescens TaxID=2320851 RepID=UPI001FE0C152|nr:hypothetical protein [Arthrobacter celericrescens]
MESLGDNSKPDEPGLPDNNAGSMRKVTAVVVLLLGLAAVIAGMVTAVIGANQPLDFGFVAPAPDFFNLAGAAILGPLTQAGYVIALVGLLVLAMWAGLRRGARARTNVVMLLLGLAVVIAGVVTALAGKSQPVSFGWFAYAPLANETFSPPGIAFLGPMTQAGLVTVVVGLLVLAFWAGHRLGKRR